MSYRAYCPSSLGEAAWDYEESRITNLADYQPLAERNTLAEIEEFAWAIVGRDHHAAVALFDSENRSVGLVRCEKYGEEIAHYCDGTMRMGAVLLYCLMSFIATIGLDLQWLGLTIFLFAVPLHEGLVRFKRCSETRAAFVGLILLSLLYAGLTVCTFVWGPLKDL